MQARYAYIQHASSFPWSFTGVVASEMRGLRCVCAGFGSGRWQAIAVVRIAAAVIIIGNCFICYMETPSYPPVGGGWIRSSDWVSYFV